MPHRCVVGGCSNFRSLGNGIVLHTIPFYSDERPEAKEEMDRFCKTETCSKGAIEEFRDMLETFQAR